MKLRWIFGAIVLALLAGNLATTWYTYWQTNDRIDAQTARINRDATNVTTSVDLGSDARGRPGCGGASWPNIPGSYYNADQTPAHGARL
jgi:hypothetical protein